MSWAERLLWVLCVVTIVGLCVIVYGFVSHLNSEQITCLATWTRECHE